MFKPNRINEILNNYTQDLENELNNINLESINLSINVFKLNTNYINYLGVCYECGNIIPVDYNKAFRLYKYAHENNNINATYNLANCYLDGKGTIINYKKAFNLYNLAHINNNINATNNLANCYFQGIGVKINYNKAFILYKYAYENNNTNSIINLANCYYKGKGTIINYNKAFTLYNLAYNLKHKYASYNLAIYYYEGKVIKNIIKAIELFIESNDINTLNLIKILPNEYNDVLNYMKHIKNPQITNILTTKIPNDIIFNYFNNQIKTLHTLKDLGMYNALSDKIMKYAY